MRQWFWFQNERQEVDVPNVVWVSWSHADFLSSAVNHKCWTQMNLMCWRSSLSFSMTVIVQNQVWMQLDAHYSLRNIDCINATTPTCAAFFKHVLHFAYQAGYIWGQSLIAHATVPNPNKWGRKKGSDGALTVHWTYTNPISDVRQAMKKCRGKNERKRRCTCSRLPCTSVCTVYVNVNLAKLLDSIVAEDMNTFELFK